MASKIKSFVENASEGARRGAAAAKRDFEAVRPQMREAAGAIATSGRAAFKTPTGKAAAQGGIGGALVGAALPFVGALTCAALGAGVFILWQGARDRKKS